MLIHTIPPVYDKNSKILILGSFPSVKSREEGFFYGHPQNRFWKVLSALFGSKGIALIAFPAVGFSISMMYSIVFSLALNSASQHHGSFAGILCSAIVGGAGGPMIVSTIADATSLRTGMLFILVFVGYITFIGFWARPLINNKTVKLKKLFKKA